MPTVEASPKMPPSRGDLTSLRLGAGAAAAAALFAALLFVPILPTSTSGVVSHDYYGSTYGPTPQPPTVEINLPVGATVHVNWFEVHHEPVLFEVAGHGYGGAACPWYNDTSGSCSFVSAGDRYELILTGHWDPELTPVLPGWDVNYTIQFTRPLLVL